MMYYYIESYGCSANQNNSEIAEAKLISAGFSKTNIPEQADIIIINTCIVKTKTEQKMLSRIEKFKNKKLIVMGCMPNLFAKKIKAIAPKAGLIGTNDIDKIVYAIRKIFENKEAIYLSNTKKCKASMFKNRKEKIIGITQISEGCLGNCTYCITKLVKGKLYSYNPEEILKSIKRDLVSGCKEIWLTSQDNAAYGKDIGINLVYLLKQIIKLPWDFKLRIGMMNPNNVLEFLDDLLEVYEDEKIYKFIHLPLQSGSNKILVDMKRQYKVEDFIKIIEKFRKKFPLISISTDVIVGYPTETEEDFNETFELIAKIKPDFLNISRYGKREGTEAAKLKMLDAREVMKRTKKLMILHKRIALEKNIALKDKICNVLVNSKKRGDFLARDENYRLFVIKTKQKLDLIGKNVAVLARSIYPHYVIAEFVQEFL